MPELIYYPTTRQCGRLKAVECVGQSYTPLRDRAGNPSYVYVTGKKPRELWVSRGLREELVGGRGKERLEVSPLSTQTLH